jgi:hypothetical protein
MEQNLESVARAEQGHFKFNDRKTVLRHMKMEQNSESAARAAQGHFKFNDRKTFGFGALTAADGTGGKHTTIKTNTGAGPAPLSPYMDGTDLPGGDMRTGTVYECMVYGV